MAQLRHGTFKKILRISVLVCHYNARALKHSFSTNRKAFEVVRAFGDGEIDGMTTVWTPGMEEWKAMSDVTELKEILAHAIDDEEEDGSAGGEEEIGQKGDEGYDPATMMYLGPDSEDELAMPHLDEDARKGLLSKRVTERGGKEMEEVRSFTGDNGLNYRWSEEEQNWVVGGKGDDDEGDQEDSGGETDNNSNNKM